MNCMKCGSEIPDTQVFCDSCLDVMANYPVKPGTPVHLPRRAPRVEKKHSRKIPPAEVIRQQRRVIRWLLLTVVVLFVAFCLAAGLFLKELSEPVPQATPMGRNYIADTTAP